MSTHPEILPRRAAGDACAIDQARYRALIEQNAAGIAELDLAGHFRLVNPKFCEITGYAAAELLGMRAQDVATADDLPHELCDFENLLVGGAPVHREKCYFRKDGSPVWVSLSIARIQPDSTTSSVLVVVVDRSERHRAEARLQHMAERYQTLVDSVDAGFCLIEVLLDAAGRPSDYVFIDVNERFEATTGLRNPVGRRMRELAPEHEQFWFDEYGRVALTGTPTRFEHEARALHRWYDVHAFRIDDPAQRHVAILFEDITERKRSECSRALLAEVSDRLAGLQEEAAIIRTTVDLVGKWLQANRCFFVECLEQENRVLTSAQYIREDTAPLPRELSLYAFGGTLWWHVANQGDFAVTDVTTDPFTRDHADAYRALDVRSYIVQPYRVDGPWTIGLVASDATPRAWTVEEKKLVDDVVARVWPMVQRARSHHALRAAHELLEQRVVERTAKLQHTVSELEAFSYTLSHDLRAPLRAMQTYARILLEEAGELTAEAQLYLSRIRVAADRMDRLIQDVLVLSQVARDAMPLERIELGSFIAGIIESYPNIREAAPHIEFVPPFPVVYANPAALTQCISNLLGNALKFIPSGVKPAIRIWAHRHHDRVCLFIQDNGIGIPEDAHEKIFGMFYQVDQKRDGTGIGLAVVRKAAERMGGAVGVHSKPGEGSTFWLELLTPPGDDA